MIEAGLFGLLSVTPAITSLGAKIYPVVRPTGAAYPCITYKMIAAKPGPTLDTSGFQRWRVEFNCFSDTFSVAASLRAALRSTLEGFNGVLSDGTLLQDAQFIQLGDDFEDDPRIYCLIVEFYLFFNFQ